MTPPFDSKRRSLCHSHVSDVAFFSCIMKLLSYLCVFLACDKVASMDDAAAASEESFENLDDMAAEVDGLIDHDVPVEAPTVAANVAVGEAQCASAGPNATAAAAPACEQNHPGLHAQIVGGDLAPECRALLHDWFPALSASGTCCGSFTAAEVHACAFVLGSWAIATGRLGGAFSGRLGGTDYWLSLTSTRPTFGQAASSSSDQPQEPQTTPLEPPTHENDQETPHWHATVDMEEQQAAADAVTAEEPAALMEAAQPPAHLIPVANLGLPPGYIVAPKRRPAPRVERKRELRKVIKRFD